MKNVKEWVKRRLDQLRNPRCIILNLAEFFLVALGVITFAGDKIIGLQPDPQYFWICLCIYMVYPIYRLIDHVMKTISEVRQGTWGWKK